MKPRLSILILLASALLMLLATPVDGGEAAPSSSSSPTVTTVTLRSTVRLAADNEQLSIGDLARVHGPQAQAIEALLIKKHRPIETGKWIDIHAGLIRELVDQASTVRAGSVVIVGNEIAITRRRVALPSVQGPDETNLSANASGPILQDHIEQWLYRRLGTKPETTRIRFENRFHKLLQTSTQGRVVEVSEIGRSLKINLRVTIYEGDRIIEDQTLRVDVDVQRMVRVAVEQIKRRTILSTDHSIIEKRWISPAMAIADPEKSIGLECKSQIKPGSIVMSSMLTQQVLVKRGQLVSARSLVGGIVVTRTVRALKSGTLGDVIELESRDHKSKFNARIAGEGRVVIIKNPQETNTLN